MNRPLPRNYKDIRKEKFRAIQRNAESFVEKAEAYLIRHKGERNAGQPRLRECVKLATAIARRKWPKDSWAVGSDFCTFRDRLALFDRIVELPQPFDKDAFHAACEEISEGYGPSPTERECGGFVARHPHIAAMVKHRIVPLQFKMFDRIPMGLGYGEKGFRHLTESEMRDYEPSIRLIEEWAQEQGEAHV